MKTKFYVTGMLLALALSAQAIRPIHRLFPVKQADGTTVMLYKGGDRNFSYYTTPENQVVVRNAEGTLCYAQIKDGALVATSIVAHDAAQRTADELAFVASNTLTPANETLVALAAGKPKTNGPKYLSGASTLDGLGKYGTSASGAVPTIGNVTIPVIMVQFSDTKFQSTTTIEKLTRFFNEEGYNEDNSYERGSVKDYFVDQSRGMFTPTFDVVALVTLDNGYAYYGQHYGNSSDRRAYQMVSEAVEKAVAQGVDFSKYISEKTNNVPNVTIYYAGPGEATGGGDDTIWPHEMDMSGSYGNFSGTKFGSYFVGNELYGTSESTDIMGMGVFCHEFSHAMGLPDFYDPTYSYEFDNPLGMWSLMDTGSYANGAYAPVGYNAYERSFMGWLDIRQLSDEETVTLTNPNETEGEMAVMVRNPKDTKEYFIFENRQPGTWYNSSFGSGLLVTRFAYSSMAWRYNTVNTTQSLKRAMVVTASGRANSDGSALPGDLYGNGTNNKTTHVLYGGSTLDDCQLYKIMKQPDGTVTFNFRNKELAQKAVANDEVYEKIADAGLLAKGDTVIFVSEKAGVALSTDAQGTSLGAVNVQVAGGKAYGNDKVQKFVLGTVTSGETTGYTFYAKDEKKYLRISNEGSLTLARLLKANSSSTASLTFTDGSVAIVFGASAANATVGFDDDAINFSGFEASQNNVQLYRKTTAASGIATIESDANSSKTLKGVYNLNGQYVGASLDGLTKGIYIHQGRKVVVK